MSCAPPPKRPSVPQQVQGKIDPTVVATAIASWHPFACRLFQVLPQTYGEGERALRTRRHDVQTPPWSYRTRRGWHAGSGRGSMTRYMRRGMRTGEGTYPARNVRELPVRTPAR